MTTRTPQHSRRLAPGRGSFVLIALLLIATPWSGATTGTGASENSTFVTAKLLLLMAAGVIAWVRRPKGHTPLPPAFLVILLYGGSSMVGAVFVPGAVASDSVTRGIRFLAICTLVAWLAPRLSVASLARAGVLAAIGLGGLAIGARLAGLTSGPQGRLNGFVPPLHPNSLAGIVGIGALVAVFAWVHAEQWLVPPWAVALGLALALLATGSRTSGAALVVGLIAMIASGGLRDRRGVGLTWVVAVVTLSLFLVMGPAELWQAVTRGGQSTVDATFSGRSFAWASVRQSQHSVQQMLFGQGLAVKRVVVSQQFGTDQTVDGSWHSAYLEGGLMGVALLTAAALMLLRRIKHLSDRERGLAAALAGFVLSQSVLESTLNDVSYSFIVFLVLLLMPIPRQRSAHSTGLRSRAAAHRSAPG